MRRTQSLKREANAPIPRGVGHCQGDGMSAAIVAPFVNDIIAKANFSRSSRSAEYGNFNALPPGLKCFLLDDARHRHGTIRSLARIIDAQNLTPLIGEG